ncbi:hypothetical protein [Faecalimonas sp.]
MRKKRVVTQMILFFYIVEIVLIKFQGENIWLNNFGLLLPMGLLFPRIWKNFQKINSMLYVGGIWSVFLEICTLFGGYKPHIVLAMIEGIVGTIVGYFGYYVCEKVSI